MIGTYSVIALFAALVVAISAGTPQQRGIR
jgi:hypothetical protein